MMTMAMMMSTATGKMSTNWTVKRMRLMRSCLAAVSSRSLVDFRERPWLLFHQPAVQGSTVGKEDSYMNSTRIEVKEDWGGSTGDEETWSRDALRDRWRHED